MDTEKMFTWISVLSRGGLTQPSEDWIKDYDALEAIFTSIHGTHTSLSRKAGITNEVMTKCQEALPAYPKE